MERPGHNDTAITAYITEDPTKKQLFELYMNVVDTHFEEQIDFFRGYFSSRKPLRGKTWSGRVPTGLPWTSFRKLFTSHQVSERTCENIDLERMETILYEIMATVLMKHPDEAFLYALLDNLATNVTEILIRRQRHRHREC